jgi:hypothetical protein
VLCAEGRERAWGVLRDVLHPDDLDFASVDGRSDWFWVWG